MHHVQGKLTCDVKDLLHVPSHHRILRPHHGSLSHPTSSGDRVCPRETAHLADVDGNGGRGCVPAPLDPSAHLLHESHGTHDGQGCGLATHVAVQGPDCREDDDHDCKGAAEEAKALPKPLISPRSNQFVIQPHRISTRRPLKFAVRRLVFPFQRYLLGFSQLHLTWVTILEWLMQLCFSLVVFFCVFGQLLPNLAN